MFLLVQRCWSKYIRNATTRGIQVWNLVNPSLCCSKERGNSHFGGAYCHGGTVMHLRLSDPISQYTGRKVQWHSPMRVEQFNETLQCLCSQPYSIWIPFRLVVPNTILGFHNSEHMWLDITLFICYYYYFQYHMHWNLNISEVSVTMCATIEIIFINSVVETETEWRYNLKVLSYPNKKSDSFNSM